MTTNSKVSTAASDGSMMTRCRHFQFWIVALAIAGSVACASCGSPTTTGAVTTTTGGGIPRCGETVERGTFQAVDFGPVSRNIGSEITASGPKAQKVYTALCNYLAHFVGAGGTQKCPIDSPAVKYVMSFDSKGLRSIYVYHPRGCAYFSSAKKRAYEVGHAEAFESVKEVIAVAFAIPVQRLEEGEASGR